MNSGFDSSGRRIAVTQPAESQDLETDAGETDLKVPGLQFDPGDHVDLDSLDGETREICIAFASQALWRFAVLIADERKPKRAIYALLYRLGAGQFVGGSGTSIANCFGVSKQALFQQGQKILATLDLRKNALGKTAAAKKQYALRNRQNRKAPSNYE